MRPIRRKDREITERDALAILDAAEYGVLSTVGKDGQPYGVPLSFVRRNNELYIHCALSGRKLDNLAHNPNVCFCVVGRTRVLPASFATEYESAVVFGTAREVTGTERHNALRWLLEKYCPGYLEEGEQYIAQKDRLTKVIRIAIRHISGKARR